MVSIRPGHDFLCLTRSGQTLSQTRRLRHQVLWEGSSKSPVSNTLCSVLRSTICLQLRVLWVLRNVSTESLRPSHAVFPVPSGQVKDKAVPVKSRELLRLGTSLLNLFSQKGNFICTEIIFSVDFVFQVQ